MVKPDGLIPGKIAVIGLSCQFPKATNATAFWQGLLAGYDGVTRIASERAIQSGVKESEAQSGEYVLAKGVLEGAEEFDAEFFSMSPREAEITDPQQRLFLEACWQALDDAGYPPDGKPQNIGVFGGSNFDSYLLLKAQTAFDLRREGLPFDFRIGNDKDYLTTRVSYRLNLTGPSLAVQSACSTSLSALHIACRSLLVGECEIALAGAVSVKFPLHAGHRYQPGGMYPQDGLCRPFDARGEGPPDGDGVAVLALRPLAAAERDGDNILAVILGTALNNDGAARVGFTAPGVPGQKGVINAALTAAGVAPESIDFIETHGTATPLGDAIELAALAAAYPEKDAGYLIGSVKSNIGHLNVASGMAGLVKTVLSLKHAVIPPTINHTEANTHLPLGGQRFQVATEVQPWPAGSTPRRAAVSSFGIGSTNAHVILEAYDPPAPAQANAAPQLVVLSARTPASLAEMAEALADFAETTDGVRLDDIARSTQMGRARFPLRLAVAADTPQALARGLRACNAPGRREDAARDSMQGLVFVFPGLGEHYPGMARELYEGEPHFREVFQGCLDLLEEDLSAELLSALFPAAESPAVADPFKAMLAGARRAAEQPLDRVDLAHLSLFVLEYALARTLMGFGLNPVAMVGYSIGEYVAACLAGVMSLADALRLVTARAGLIRGLGRGAMLAISASEEELRPRLPDGVHVGAVNGPLMTVVSGRSQDVDAFSETLEKEGLVSRPTASYPFHSKLMDAIVPDLERLYSDVSLKAPKIPIASTVTGRWMSPEDATDPHYWSQHLSRPVLFSEALRTVAGLESPVRFVEVGPGNSLCNVVRQNLDELHGEPIAAMRHRYEEINDRVMLLSAVGAAWAGGIEPDWRRLSGATGRRISLPGYRFDRAHYALPISEGRQTDPERGARLSSAEWGFVSTWSRSRPLPSRVGSREGVRVLVFDTPDGTTAEVARRMVDDAADLCLVTDGDGFAEADGRFTIDMTRETDHQLLFASLACRGFHPTHILVGPLTGGDFATLRHDDPPSRLARRLKAVVHLLQAHGVKMNSAAELILFTRGGQAVLGTEDLDPLEAMLWGLEKTVSQEFSNIQCRCIDLLDGMEDLSDALAAECLRAGGSVALRGRYVWEPGLSPLPDHDAGNPSPVREGGTYVIAGGLGHIGLTIAEALAATAPIRLVLLNRSLDVRADLDASLRHQPAARRVGELEAAGAEVVLMRCDIGDYGVLHDGLTRLRHSYGRIDGIVNAAGVGGGAPLALRGDEAIDQVLAPKVLGSINLDRASAEDDLDFMLVCSSISALCGGMGLGDHAAANAFLDTFCQWRSRARRGMTISVNWDYWSEAGLGLEAVQLAPSQTDLRDARVEASPLLDKVRLGPAGSLIFSKLFSVDEEWILSGHTVAGHPVLPGTGYLELARQAAEAIRPDCAVELRDMTFVYPFLVRADLARELELHLAPEAEGYDLRMVSLTNVNGEPQETVHCTGSVRFTEPTKETAGSVPEGLGEPGVLPKDGQLHLGPRWQNYTRRWRNDTECVALLDLPEAFADDLDAYPMHPAMLDIATSFAIQGYGFYMPISYRRLLYLGPFTRRVSATIHQALEDVRDRDVVTLDVTVSSEEGQVVARVEGITLKRIDDVRGNIDAWTTETREGRAGSHPAPVGKGNKDPYLTRRIENGITRKEGVEWIHRILSRVDTDRIVVSTVRPADWLPEETGCAGAAEQAAKLYDRPRLASEYVEPETDLERSVVDVFREVLGINTVGANDSFFDLGGDSLKGIQLGREIGRRTGLGLSVQDLYKAPTARQIASTLTAEEERE